MVAFMVVVNSFLWRKRSDISERDRKVVILLGVRKIDNKTVRIALYDC